MDAAKNIERFLGKNADESELKEACIDYQPRNSEHNRLEIIICTPEQQEIAWRYGHSSLILLDGTFGIRSRGKTCVRNRLKSKAETSIRSKASDWRLEGSARRRRPRFEATERDALSPVRRRLRRPLQCLYKKAVLHIVGTS